MASNPRYCRYNCEYMCSMCQEAELRDSKNPAPKTPSSYNPLSDEDEGGMWMGYGNPQININEDGELTGFPLKRYMPTGATTTYTPYVPPPPKVLKEQQVLLVEEIPPISPNQLIKGKLITP